VLSALHRQVIQSRRRVAVHASAALDGFELTLRASGRTEATVEWYEARLSRLVKFLGDPELRKIAPDELRRWLVAVKNGPAGIVSDNYVDGHRKAAAALFAWAIRDELLTVSPMRAIARYKVERREFAILSPADVGRLMDEQPTNTHEGIRNRAIIAFLYDTGVRVGELVHLELDDVDLVAGTARVRGKSRRERTVPISPTLRSLLWNYINAARPKQLFATSSRLFLSRDGSPIRETAINQWLARAGERVGLHVYPHKFRHSFATAFLRNGGDPFTLQLILGHSTSDMTRRYVHVVASDAAKRHQSASPLERIRAR
jgi:site-specific recombinase XerD